MSRILLLVPFALQLLCIVHVMKTGRAYYWIWIIIILPYVGGLAYLIVEIFPGIFARRNLGAVRENVANAIAPGRKLQALRDRAAYSPAGDYSGASELLGRLPRNPQGFYEQKAWNALHLRLLEKTESPQAVAAEYGRTAGFLNDRETDLQYLEYRSKQSQ